MPLTTVRPLPGGAGSLFFFQAEDGMRDATVTGVQTCALPISAWAEVPPDHPAVRKPAGDEGRDVTLYWNGAAWVELLPGVELRYSHLTDSSREVADAPDADRVRAASASSV